MPIADREPRLKPTYGPPARITPGLIEPGLVLSTEHAARIEGWATSRYPYEACGLLVGRDQGAESAAAETVSVVRARNLNRERPGDRYLLDPDTYLATDREARSNGLDIIGIWHSHPDCPARPSMTDLEGAWEGLSYVIVTTTEHGAGELRSWRLRDGAFVEEAIRHARTNPTHDRRHGAVQPEETT